MQYKNQLKRALAIAGVVAGMCTFTIPITLAQVEQSAQKTTQHPLTQPERTEAINGLLKWIDSDYILPNIAKQMSEAIRGHQAKHEYDSITDGEQFARTLTHDLQEVSHDHHLGGGLFRRAYERSANGRAVGRGYPQVSPRG